MSPAEHNQPLEHSPGARVPQASELMPPAAVAAWQRRALLIAVPFTVLAVIGWILASVVPHYDQFYRSYLLGYLLCWGVSVGSLAVLMIYHTTGGEWGTVLRRILEAASRTLWAVAIGFIPILIGIHRLYPWSRAEEIAKDPHLQQTLGPQYLNLKYFIARALLYFVAWIALAIWMNRQSDRQDLEPVVLDRRLRHVGGAGLVVYAFTVTFAAIDWGMSLDLHWTSTIYGLLYFAGQGLITWSFAVIVLGALVRYRPMREIVRREAFLDNGKLLLACTMLWGWFTLSQWLIIWAGNLPEEIAWYLSRTRGGWREFAYFLVIGQFFIPFFLLLSRSLKSDGRTLGKLALWIIFMRYCDLYWFVMPNFENRKGHFHFSWQDAAVPIAMASWWVYLFLGYLRRRPLLAVYDDHVKLLLEKGHELEHERA
jgi:hypothetical protein